MLGDYIIRESVLPSKSEKAFKEAIIEVVSFCGKHVIILTF